MNDGIEGEKLALLSQEGSVIATRSREGWFPSEPPRRFAPPLLTQEGSFSDLQLIPICVQSHHDRCSKSGKDDSQWHLYC
jgi:hypothetical protein